MFLYISTYRHNFLETGVDGVSETNSLLANIVDVAEGSDPGVSKNPGWAETTGVHAEEGQSALKQCTLV